MLVTFSTVSLNLLKSTSFFILSTSLDILELSFVITDLADPYCLAVNSSLLKEFFKSSKVLALESFCSTKEIIFFFCSGENALAVL